MSKEKSEILQRINKGEKKLMKNILNFLILMITAFSLYGNDVQQTSSKQLDAIRDSLTTLVNTKFEYLGNGYIKIEDFPKWPSPENPQGNFNIKDINDSVIMDMNLPNEVLPHGALEMQYVGGWFPFDDISMPADHNEMTPWGQIFIQDGKKYPENAKLHIKNLALICYRNSTKSWEIINDANTIDGLFFKENYEDQSTKPANIHRLKDEIVVDIDSSTRGRCFHFWTDHVKISDPSDILYTTVYCDCWVSGNNTDDIFAFDVGADYKKVDNKGNTLKITECIGGRFKSVRSYQRRVYATNLSYDKYFKLCSQEIIDNAHSKK